MKKNILIVEDEPVVALDYKLFFESKGYICKTFSSGLKALNFIKTWSPDVAILDIRVKDKVSGIDVGRKLKLLNVPLVFISAFSNPFNRLKALSLKPALIFEKPVLRHNLKEVVDKVLEED